MDHSYLIEIIASLPIDHECRTHGAPCKGDQPSCEEFYRYSEDAKDQLNQFITLARKQIASETQEAVL